MFYNRARIFVPFDLGFGTGENSPGTLLSTCLNMISNCVQYGGPYRYPASENATAAFVLLELTGCVENVGVSSGIVSATITEYGRQVQEGASSLSIVHRVSCAMMEALALGDVGCIDQAKESLRGFPESARNMITDHLRRSELSPRTDKMLSTFIERYVSEAWALLLEASIGIAASEFSAASELCHQLSSANNALLSDNNALRSEIAELRAMLAEASPRGDPTSDEIDELSAVRGQNQLLTAMNITLDIRNTRLNMELDALRSPPQPAPPINDAALRSAQPQPAPPINVAAESVRPLNEIYVPNHMDEVSILE